MCCRRTLGVSGLFLACLTLLPACGDSPAPSPPKAEGLAPERPRLVVLLVFDQMRGDYLDRWEKLYVKDGFRRLRDEGAWFRNCHHPYAATLTSAGHASMATGCPPRRHGIIANS